jgi:membrane associated rhomboid family serine protease
MARQIFAAVAVLLILGLVLLAVVPRFLSDDLPLTLDRLAELAGVETSWQLVGLVYGVVYFVLGMIVATAVRPGARWVAYGVCAAVAAFTVFFQVISGYATEPGAALVGALLGSGIGVLLIAVLSRLGKRKSAAPAPIG